MQNVNRWMYQSGKPNRIARILNHFSAWTYKLGWMPDLLDTLEVTGRKSGNPVEMPVVVVHRDRDRYLVSMLGTNTNWVKNVRATGGKAALLKGGRVPIRLEDVPVENRAPIIKRYCQIAPGGRSHISVDKDAPLDQFEAIAEDYPVFRIVPLSE